MKWKILISAPYMQPQIKRFRSFFEEHDMEMIIPKVKERLSEDELLKYLPSIDGIVCGDDQITEKVIQNAPKLKVISKWGTGIDSIDQKACENHGILIKNTPNAFSLPVADTIMGFILCFARNISSQTTLMKKGIWEKIPGRALNECTIGIIGVGNVGKAVVKRAKAFGMKVLGNDIKEISNDFSSKYPVEMCPKEKLLAKSDFVSLNCDLNPSSYHLMTESFFNIMKKTAYIINTSRGSVIKEDDLIEALKTGKIKGAGLDVFEVEPIDSSSPLLKMDNVFLSAHNSNCSKKAWEHVHINTLNNLLNGLKESNR